MVIAKKNLTIHDLPRIERPREKLIKYGVDKLSNTELLAIILPGDPEPSEDDLELNRRLVEAGKILGIEVMDHIVVSKSGYFSFKEQKLL